MSHIYNFVYRTNLELVKFIVSWINKWSDGLIVDFGLGKEWDQNPVINNAGSIHERCADYR